MAFDDYRAVVHQRSQLLFWNASDGAPASVSYSFVTSLPSPYLGKPEHGFTSALSGAQVTAAHQIFDVLLPQFANITFSFGGQSQSSKIRLWNAPVLHLTKKYNATTTDLRFGGPGAPLTNQDIALDNGIQNYAQGGYGFYALLHEALHAIGFKHSNYDGDVRNVQPYLSSDADAVRFSVMRSKERFEFAWNAAGILPSTPMLYDVAGLQQIYGPNLTTGQGNNDVYTFSSTTPELRTIWDAGGSGDKLSAENQSVGARIDLRPGEFSAIGPQGKRLFNVAIAYNHPTVVNNYIEDAIGSTKEDEITGNDGNNVLTGLNGNDTLAGGKGNDILQGGAGLDRYEWNTGDGNDQIVDSDRQGAIYVNGKLAKTFREVPGSNNTLYINSNGGISLTKQSSSTLHLPDGSTINLGETFADGDLDINLRDAQAAHTDESITLTLAGDLEPVDFDPETPGIQTQTDSLGNVIVTSNPETGRADVLFGDASANLIQSLGGNDLVQGGGGDDDLDGGDGGDEIVGNTGFDDINGGAGNDLLYGLEDDDAVVGGTGDDTVRGGAGYDHVAGGTGRDIVLGEAGDDEVFALDVVDIFQGIDAAETEGGSAFAGDFLDGGAGEDVALGTQTGDFLTGGGGADVLAGGGGDDNLMGDQTYAAGTADWTATRIVTPDGSGGFTFELQTTNLFLGFASDGAGDEMYGGTGADWIFSHAGDDYIDGGADNDVLIAYDGHDALYGGTGDDVLSGDLSAAQLPSAQHGSDYLDGEDGADTLFGGGGADELFGGAGNDFLYGDDSLVDPAHQGADYLDGEDGADFLRGFGGDDEVFGGAGADTLVGNEGNDYLDGEEDNDQILGEDGDDLAYGGSGNDTMTGNAGTDVLDGEDGADSMYGGGGLDALEGGLGADTLHGGSGDDQLDGGDDADVLFGDADDATPATEGNDIVDGGAGNDQLVGAGGADTLIGGDGDDLHFGQAGSDTFDPGAGVDEMQGEAGNDTYIFGRGYGQDLIFDQDTTVGNIDKIEFVADVSPDQVIATRGPVFLNDLVLTVTGTSDSLTIANQFFGAQHRVEEVRFADGTVWAPTNAPNLIQGTSGNNGLNGTSSAEVILGLSGNDTLLGGAGNDTIDGGTGNDELYGQGGGDTYLYYAGWGQDTIRNADADGSSTIDIVQFVSGITPASVIPTRSGNDLLLTRDVDQVRLVDYFLGGTAIVEQIKFSDGTIWTEQTIGALFPITGTSGNDNLTGTGLSESITGLAGNDTLNGGAGNDTLDGGTGSDTLYGAAGSDTYLYAVGWGQDTIINADQDSLDGIPTTDVLEFASGITPASVTRTKSGNNLVLTRGADQVTLTNYFLGGTAIVEQIKFADGTIWTEQTIGALFPITGTSGNDNLTGTGLSESITALAGNDTINAGGGNDTVDGGLGTDSIMGGAGNDVLIAGTGDAKNAPVFNYLHGNDGDDVLIGSAKRDDLYGGNGNDIYLAGAEYDWLEDTGGNNLFDGGVGLDLLVNLGDQNDIAMAFDDIDGDRDGDGIRGRDVLLVNKTENADTVSVGLGSTLSFGGGLLYSNLSFEALINANSGVLVVNYGNKSTWFQGWYGDSINQPNKCISYLQIVIEGTSNYNPSSPNPWNNKKVQVFDFLGLVAAWDAAGRPTNWNVAANLPNFHLWGSDTLAIGGAVAYQYNKNGSISSLTHAEMQAILAAPEFAVSGQPITAGAGMMAMEGGAPESFAETAAFAEDTGTKADTTQSDSAERQIRPVTHEVPVPSVIELFSGLGEHAAAVALHAAQPAHGVAAPSAPLNNPVAANTSGGFDFAGPPNANPAAPPAVAWSGFNDLLSLQRILDAIGEFDGDSNEPAQKKKSSTQQVTGRFGHSVAEGPGLTSWAMTNALLQYHLVGADDATLGGDLRYWGRNDALAGLNLTGALDAVASGNFSTEAKQLRPFGGLQEGYVKLS